jgi:hypothetical protein
MALVSSARYGEVRGKAIERPHYCCWAMQRNPDSAKTAVHHEENKPKKLRAIASMVVFYYPCPFLDRCGYFYG